MITYKKRFYGRTTSVTKDANGHYTVEHDAGIFKVIGGGKNFDNTKSVGAFFLGRCISDFIAVKTDEKGDRIIDLSSANGMVNEIEVLLENG